MGDTTKLQYVTLDVFTTKRYIGNPLAIVRVPRSIELTQTQKQLIAREFNYSETVILHESEESYRKSEWTINIFLTTSEIPLAGHPVIGTVCYLASMLQTTGASGTIAGTLNTKAGKVPFTYSTSSKRAEAEIPHDVHLHDRNFPAEEAEKYNVPSKIIESMKGPGAFFSIVKGMTFCLIELSSLEALAKAEIGLKPLGKEGLNQEYQAGGFVGYFFFVKQGKSDAGATKLRTRMLDPTLEDPATGSASSALAVYLSLYDQAKDSQDQDVHKFEMTQGVEMGRQSDIGIEIRGDRSSKKLDKVMLSGSSMEIMEGSLVIPSH